MRSLPLATAALAAVVLGLTACGESDEEQIRAAYASFIDGLKQKDPAKICEIVILPPQVTQPSCEQSQAGGLTSLDVAIDSSELREVEIQGERATAQGVTQSGPGGAMNQQELLFVKRDGTWKIDLRRK